MQSASTVILAIVFYASLALLIETIEIARERRKQRDDVVVNAPARRKTVWMPRAWLHVPWTVLIVGIATGMSYALAPDVFAPEDVVMLYVAAIVVAALRFGLTGSLVASTLSVVAYDFFFVPPKYTFSIASPRHLLTFAMMFAVGIVLSSLARRLKRQSVDAALKGRSEQMKTALLSAVSHDLRTPLATITGAATTLRDDGGRIPDDERMALLDTIADQGFHLERLVTNLLDMTRVESGALRLKREWMPVEEIVGSAIARTEKRLGDRTVHTELDAGTPLVHVDPALFELVLVNLFDNAAKYTPSTSTIEVSSRAHDGSIELCVRDDGPGLPAGVDVFERFVRGPGASGGGVGLGLAIAKGIVEAHGGRINIDGGDVDTRGAAFRITLPREVAPLVPEAP